ncbi:hypothetical protein ACR0ST_00830 [Aliidiomarina sp. Khilg15.8]
MDLTAMSGVAAAQTQRADKDENKFTPQPPAMQPQVQKTTAEISPQAQQMAETERSLGQRFDVQNLSESEFKEMRTELRENGLISGLEAEELTTLFNEGQKSLQALKQGSEQPQNLLSMLGEQVEDGNQSSRLGGLFEMFNAMAMQQS